MGQAQRRESTGQTPQNERKEHATEEKKSEPNRAAEERRDNGRNARDNERGNREDHGARGTARRETTGPGTAPTRGNISVNITPEYRTRIHELIVKERSASRVDHVDFSLSVGTAVPHSVRIVAVPRDIIEIEPEWRGFDYFIVGEQIVIVDPRSMEIVAVFDV